MFWFRLSRSALIFECLLFGLKDRGPLILLLPDVSSASVAGIFRGLGFWVVARRIRATTQEPSHLKMPATDAGETSGRRSIGRPRFLCPKSKHSNISADRESLYRRLLCLQLTIFILYIFQHYLFICFYFYFFL